METPSLASCHKRTSSSSKWSYIYSNVMPLMIFYCSVYSLAAAKLIIPVGPVGCRSDVAFGYVAFSSYLVLHNGHLDLNLIH